MLQRALKMTLIDSDCTSQIQDLPGETWSRDACQDSPGGWGGGWEEMKEPL